MRTDLGQIVAEPVDPQEAIEFFRSKGLAPPEARFDYRDWWGAQHARGFVVAKAMKDDVLQTIREHVDRAIAEGRTLDEFRAELTPELQRLGWWGRQDVVDPATGRWEDVQLGSQRRLQVIFDTNIRTSYAAGRWARLQRTKRQFPYLMYRQIQRPTKRDEHEPFNDLILPVDHPFWQTHFPPNGYFCGCTVRQLSEGALKRRKLKVGRDPTGQTRKVQNRRTGEIEDVPLGIAPGFATNPGAAWLDLRERSAQVTAGLARTEASAELGLATEIRARGLRDGVESLAAYDPAADEVIDWNRGDAGAVSITEPMREAMSDATRRVTLVHNHPTADNYTLSAPDFELLQFWPGADSIVAVGHDGSVYRARKRVAGYAIGARRVSVEGLTQRAFSLVYRLAEREMLDPAEIDEVHAFVVARSLHEAGVIDYRHALTLKAQQLYGRNRQVIEYLASRLAEALTGGRAG